MCASGDRRPIVDQHASLVALTEGSVFWVKNQVSLEVITWVNQGSGENSGSARERVKQL